MGSALLACRNNSSLIEGTYGDYATSEYSIARDTIVIQAHGGPGEYKVIRKSAYQAIKNGKLQPEKREVHEFIGHFDPEAKALLIDAQGKKITFFPDKGIILVNQREYTKVVEH